MISSIRLRDFKNFADETLRLGPFTVIVGANASGKSNIRDAFRFLHGVGRGYALADIFGGKYGDGDYVEWERMRGAANEIARFGRKSFSISVDMKASKPAPLRYEIEIGVGGEAYGGFQVMKEELGHTGGEPIYTSRPDEGSIVHDREDQPRLKLKSRLTGDQADSADVGWLTCERSALAHFKENPLLSFFTEADEGSIPTAISTLSGMRFLDLTPDRVKSPAFLRRIVSGESGEDLSTVLQGICADERHKKTLIDWICELTPMDIVDFEFPEYPNSGKTGLTIREANDRRVSAHSASGGTLRFLAMLAALLGPDPARLYFFEGIDNSIHPSRLYLLLELIERQTEERGIQIVATTHSPALLTAMGNRTFENTSVVCRLPDADDAIIRPLRDIPNARDLRKEQGMGRLLEGGWMERALHFTEAAE